MKRLIVLLAISLAGCATSVFTPPQPDPAMATIATRFEYHPMGNSRWQRFEVTHIEGGREWGTDFFGEANTDFKVKPGIATLTVRATFVGWPTVPDVHGIQQATVQLASPVDRGRVYRLGGEPRGDLYFVWLEDLGTGQRVATSSVPYAPQRIEYIFIVPLKR